jgi:hypothetical protein
MLSEKSGESVCSPQIRKGGSAMKINEDIREFFRQYPRYKTCYIYCYDPGEFLDTFGDEIGYVDYWDWKYGPDVRKELFYVREGGYFKALPHVCRSGSARYGTEEEEEVGDTAPLRELLQGYKGIVIYVRHKDEGGGEKVETVIAFTYV